MVDNGSGQGGIFDRYKRSGEGAGCYCLRALVLKCVAYVEGNKSLSSMMRMTRPAKRTFHG